MTSAKRVWIQIVLIVLAALGLLWLIHAVMGLPWETKKREEAEPVTPTAAPVYTTPPVKMEKPVASPAPMAAAAVKTMEAVNLMAEFADQWPEEDVPCGCPDDWYNQPRQDNEGPALRPLGEYQVYGYDICPACCGKTDGITASGTVATVGRTAACNTLPLGTVIYIEGIGERVIEDRGGMHGNEIDVLCSDHAACYSITGVYKVSEAMNRIFLDER